MKDLAPALIDEIGLNGGTRVAPKRPGQSILIIEHDAWARATLSMQLSGLGFQVRTASNGFSGLRLAAQSQPDLIVVGASLPELPAGELLCQLRREPAIARTELIMLPISSSNELLRAVRDALNDNVGPA